MSQIDQITNNHDPSRRGSNASSAMDVCPDENSSNKSDMKIDSSSYNFSSRRSSKCSNESGIHSLKLTDSERELLKIENTQSKNTTSCTNSPCLVPDAHTKIARVLSHVPVEINIKEKVEAYVCLINPAFTKSNIFTKNPINKYVLVEPKNIIQELQPIVELYWTKKELDKANFKINKIQSYFNSAYKNKEQKEANVEDTNKGENKSNEIQNNNSQNAKRQKMDFSHSGSPSDELNIVDSTSKNSDSNQNQNEQIIPRTIQSSPEGNTTSSSEVNMLKNTATKQLEDLMKFQRQSREDMLQGLLSQIQGRNSSNNFLPNSVLSSLASRTKPGTKPTQRGSGIASLLAASRQLETQKVTQIPKPQTTSADFLRSFTSNQNFPLPKPTNSLPSIATLTGIAPPDTQVKIKLPSQLNNFTLSQLTEGSVTSEAPSQTALPSNILNKNHLPSLVSSMQLPTLSTNSVSITRDSNSNSQSLNTILGNSSSSASQSRCSTSHSMNADNMNINPESDGSSGHFKLLKKSFPNGMNEIDLEKSLGALDPDNKMAYLGPCEHCGVNLGGIEDYKTHMRRHYLDCQRKHTCDVCGKCFTTLYNLKAHMGIHSGKKPYSCQYCQKRFLRKYDMQRHERHHVCDTCGQSSNESSFLRKHLRSGMCPNAGSNNGNQANNQLSNLMKMEQPSIRDTNLLLSMTKNNVQQQNNTTNFLNSFTQNLSLAKSSSHPPSLPNLPSLGNLTSTPFNLNNLLPSPVTTFNGKIEAPKVKIEASPTPSNSSHFSLGNLTNNPNLASNSLLQSLGKNLNLSQNSDKSSGFLIPSPRKQFQVQSPTVNNLIKPTLTPTNTPITSNNTNMAVPLPHPMNIQNFNNAQNLINSQLLASIKAANAKNVQNVHNVEKIDNEKSINQSEALQQSTQNRNQNQNQGNSSSNEDINIEESSNSNQTSNANSDQEKLSEQIEEMTKNGSSAMDKILCF